MQKYLVPVLLCSAIGAVVVILVLASRDKRNGTPVETSLPTKGEPKTARESGLIPAKTPTHLRDNEALRELERMLQREQLDPKAHYFRHKVCEQMTEILESEELTRNLLNAIKEHGIDSDDPKRRDLMLGILRVMAHPEATAMIEAEYYRAKNEEERLLLLEAMAHKHHNPGTASVWAIDRALNGETKQLRHRAFMLIRAFSDNNEVIFTTAEAIYAGTTHPEQALQMIESIVYVADPVKGAQKWLRKRLENPRPDELHFLISYMEVWATRDDAHNLDRLAVAYPAMGDILRQRAEEIRLAVVLKEGDADTIAKARMQKIAREKQRERERRKAEEAKERDG